MTYLAKFNVKQECWEERIDLPEHADRAAGKLYEAVRKRGVIHSREMEVELVIKEDASYGEAIVIVGGFRAVGKIEITRVISARNKPEKHMSV